MSVEVQCKRYAEYLHFKVVIKVYVVYIILAPFFQLPHDECFFNMVQTCMKHADRCNFIKKSMNHKNDDVANVI